MVNFIELLMSVKLLYFLRFLSINLNKYLKNQRSNIPNGLIPPEMVPLKHIVKYFVSLPHPPFCLRKVWYPPFLHKHENYDNNFPTFPFIWVNSVGGEKAFCNLKLNKAREENWMFCQRCINNIWNVKYNESFIWFVVPIIKWMWIHFYN